MGGGVALLLVLFLCLCACTQTTETVTVEKLEDEVTLAAPANLKISGITNTSLKLTWDNVDGATTYYVYQADNENADACLVEDTSVTSATIENLQINTKFFFKVRAYNRDNQGKSEFSTTVSAMTLNDIAEIGSATSYDLTEAYLSWNRMDNFDEYYIYMAETEEALKAMEINAESACKVTSETSTTIKNLIPGKNYYFKIAGYNTLSKKFSDASEIEIVAMKPNTPVITSAVVVSTSEVKLTWDAVEGVDSYTVYCNTSDSTYKVEPYKSEITETSITVGDLTAGKTYYFFVKAHNNQTAKDSNFSESMSAFVYTVEAPADLKAVSTENSVTLTWAAVDGASRYYVYYGLTERCELAIDDYWSSSYVSTTSVTINGLIADTEYYFNVYGYNSNGNGKIAEITCKTAIDNQVKYTLPENVSAENKNGKISLAWDAVENAGEYQIYYAAENDITKAILDGTTDTVNYDTDLSSDTMSYFWVKSIDTTADIVMGCSAAYGFIPALTGLKCSVRGNMVDVNWDVTADALSVVNESEKDYYLYSCDADGKLKSLSPVGTYSNSDCDIDEFYVTTESAVVGTNYFKIRSWYNGFYSEYSDVASISLLATPEIKVSQITTDSIKITWNAVANATKYTVACGYIGEDDEESTGKVDENVTGTSYTFTDLKSGDYSIVMYAANDTAKSLYSAITTSTKIAAPANVDAEVSGSYLTLSWDKVAGAKGYNVYYGTKDDITTATKIDVGDVDEKSLLISGIVTDKTKCYYFRVKSYDYSATPAECEDAQSYCYVPAVANLKATSSELAKAKITWDAIDGISEYKLEYKKLSSSSYTTKTVKVNSYELTGLTCGETYDFRVTPIKEDAIFTGKAEVSVEIYVLPAPQNVVAKSDNLGEITVTWDSVTNAEEYYVYYGTTSNPTSYKTTSDTTLTLTGLTCGETYTIKVKALDGKFASGIQTVVKTLSAPQNVEVEDFEMTGYKSSGKWYINGTVSWDAVDGADYYTIQIRNAEDSTWTDYEKSYSLMKVTGTSVTLSQSDYYYNYIYISSYSLPATVELRVVAHNTEHSVTVESTALEGTVTE